MIKHTRLRIILAQKGISQAELSEMTGLEKCQISLICSGKKKNIMLETAKRICLALGSTLDETFGD